MRTYLALIMCLAPLTVGCVLPSSITRTGDIRAPGIDVRYDALIDEIERTVRQTMSRNRIPGLSIAIADSRGPIWEAGFGYADDARTTPVDGSTTFSIQSMSKTFTAVGVLTAVRDGLLDLDAPISTYLPRFRIQSIFEERPQDRITLRHLLTHTAGFTHEAPSGNNNDPAEPSFDDHVASIQDTWLMFRVGERYQYSNLGIDLAAYVLEKRTAQEFARCMTDSVFGPLGMTRSTIEPAVILRDSNRAIGHQQGFGVMPVIVPMAGAGGVYASAHDISRFLTAMLRKGSGEGQLLPPAAFREMETTPNHGGYGLGVAIGRRQGDLSFNHGGGGYGFLTCMAWYPTLDIGITILTNASWHDSAHVALAERTVDRLVQAGVVEKKFSLPSLPVCGISLGRVQDDSWYFDTNPEKTRWQPHWETYLGSYKLSGNATPLWYARFVLSLGLPRTAFVKVARHGQGMTVDGVALLEQEPGLFFSLAGEALDFRSDPPTWRNIKLQKR